MSCFVHGGALEGVTQIPVRYFKKILLRYNLCQNSTQKFSLFCLKILKDVVHSECLFSKIYVWLMTLHIRLFYTKNEPLESFVSCREH